jgi:CO/xanthine dehydrogenase Mo-binding subunit
MISNALPQSLADNPRLDQWICFEESGRVRLSTGKVELGQGILTTLAQVAAEELDVAPERLDVVSGDTRASPSEGFTSGSNSTAVSGAAVRLVCAEVRDIFVRQAARELGCEAGEVSVVDGRFVRDGDDTGRDYWSVAARVELAREATGAAATKRPRDYGLVGRNFPRTDLPEKIRGPAFIHDLAPDNVIHARVLHRPWPGARLAHFEQAEVRRRARARVEILREGDLVAVLADDEPAAMRAHEAARALAAWDGGERPPDEVDTPEWLQQARPSRLRVSESGGDDPVTGRVVESRYSRPYLTHGSIAPSVALAEFKEGALTVWTHSQGVFILRDWLARTLGLHPARITVLHRQGAGCYGHNSADDAAFEAAYLALRVPGRTVRVQWTREDEFASAPVGPASAVELRAVLDEAARPLDWTFEIWSPVHGRRPGMNGRANFAAWEALPDVPPEPAHLNDVPDEIGGGATRNGVAYYDLPRHRLLHRIVDGVPVRASTLRGLGAYLNVFAIESFMDELADLAGEDPIAYRLSLTSDPRARRVMESVAELANWPAATATSGALGFGFARYKNRAAYLAAVAEIEVLEEVRVTRVWAAVDAGLVINPDGAANQVEGGIVQTVSWALKEQVRFADGRVASDSWESYPILRFSEVPKVEVRFVDAPDEPTLGLGEASHGPTAAAIGNAVARALGTRIRDLPFTRDRVMAALLA